MSNHNSRTPGMNLWPNMIQSTKAMAMAMKAMADTARGTESDMVAIAATDKMAMDATAMISMDIEARATEELTLKAIRGIKK